MKQYFALLPFCVLLFVLPFPGTVALRLLCLSAAFAIAVMNWKRLAPPPAGMKGVFLLWAVIALASLAYSVDASYSLGEIKNELGYTAMAFVAFFVFSDDQKKLKWMLLALAGGALVISAGALLALVRSGTWEQTGWHGGTAAYASYFIMALPAMVMLGYMHPGFKWRCMVALIVLVLVAAAYFCDQRIVWPVLFLQGCVALLFLRKVFRLNAAMTAAIFIILALSLSVALMSAHAKRFVAYDWRSNISGEIMRDDRASFWPRIVERIAERPLAGAGFILALSLSVALMSAHAKRFVAYDWRSNISGEIMRDDRASFWPRIVERIAERPLAGAGFGRGIMKKAYPDLTPANNRDLWHAHNVVLNYGLSMGIPGMVVMVMIFAALALRYRQFWKASDRRLQVLGACGLALVLGVFARNMVNDMFLREGALLFWALNGCFLGYGSRLLARSAHDGVRT